MPAQRTFGMDHPHHEWSPVINRPALQWPNDAAVALCVVIPLEHMEWQVRPGSFQVARLSGGSSPREFPDYARLSHREYGHRVGIFRLLDLLQKHGIRATIAMDALTAQNYPYLVKHCQDRGCEFIGHGISVSQMITSNMTEGEEREYIQTSLEALSKATGTQPRGWFGPEYGESDRTPQLLAQAGLTYVCDWTNDEQPFPMTTGEQPFFALPLMYELDDVVSISQKLMPVFDYERMLCESLDVLKEDGATTGRLLAVNWHPWLVGQPFRIGSIDRALSHIRSQGGVWPATGSEIIDWFRQQST